MAFANEAVYGIGGAIANMKAMIRINPPMAVKANIMSSASSLALVICFFTTILLSLRDKSKLQESSRYIDTIRRCFNFPFCEPVKNQRFFRNYARGIRERGEGDKTRA